MTPYIAGLTATGTDIPAIYLNMIADHQAQLFTLENYTNVPAGSLIIFYVYRIQHSMIKIENDTWIGANNINSLGLDNALPSITTKLAGGNTGIYSYSNMSLRTYKHATTGGWDKKNMRSLTDDTYEMYYIPIFQG